MKWLVLAAVIIGFFGLLAIYSAIRWRRKAAVLLARRHNPTEQRFIGLMEPHMATETARFLWDRISAQTLPLIAPHPDDDTDLDLFVDAGDITDWLSEFAQSHGRDEKDWPDWKAGQPTTVRNLGIWLESGLLQSIR